MEYKITHFPKGKKDVISSGEYDLYSYKAYIGEHIIDLEKGDSAWIVDSNGAETLRGNKLIKSTDLCVVIRGYQCSDKSTSFMEGSNLPYVNGCSSNQLFPPVRPGDPTMQLLYIPPNTSEQAHHVHSTARVVYVLKGSGESIQGQKGDTVVPLNEGDVVVLDKMTPHHFQTGDEPLIVIPIHIYSSTPLEKNHPMFNGTFEI